MSDNNNFKSLVSLISTHLTGIADALEDYEKQSVQQKNDDALVKQLDELKAKVKSMEAQSLKTKKLLLQARKQANNLDSLTGLPNRSAYADRLFQELRRHKRYHRPAVLAVCDIDGFKQVNDAYGKAAGDKALALIAKVVQKKVRTVDYVARLGGEEFVFIMPETKGDQALQVLEKVRETIANVPFKFNGNRVQITLSFGVTEFFAGDSLETIFNRADKALYTAKEYNGNCCCLEMKADLKNVVQPSFSLANKDGLSVSKEISFK